MFSITIMCSIFHCKIKECDVCQRVNDKIVKDRPELHPVPVHSTWYHIGIDFVGPVSRSGNKYILTVSDYFSKWVCAFPLPSKEVPGVASMLFKVSICYHMNGAWLMIILFSCS